MKNALVSLIGFFVLLFVYTKLAGPIPFAVTSITTQKTDSFAVTGEGKVNVSPDLAVVTVGVQEQGATVKQVQTALNSKINLVSAAIKKLGIEAKDVQTSNYNIRPNYDWQAGKQRINGYTASSNLTIKVREIEKANSVIDAATVSGANQVGNLAFEVDDKTAAENEARQKAVSEAKKKAENAAKMAGFKLGKIINYSENFAPESRLYPLMAGGGTAEATVPTQLEAGTNEITVQVTLSYEIR